MTGTVLIIRIIFIILLLFAVIGIVRKILRFIKKQHLLKRQRIAMEANRPSGVRQQDDSLKNRFFGHKQKPELPKPNKPEVTLPIMITARVGRKFNGKDLEYLIGKFGFQYSPNSTYELIASNGKDVFCTMLNIYAPGKFPEPSELKNHEFDGMLFVLQLPVSDRPIEDWETFYAIVSEIAEASNGRLCDHTGRPMGSQDVALYHQAAEEFEREYLKWQNGK